MGEVDDTFGRVTLAYSMKFESDTADRVPRRRLMSAPNGYTNEYIENGILRDLMEATTEGGLLPCSLCWCLLPVA